MSIYIYIYMYINDSEGLISRKEGRKGTQGALSRGIGV